MKKRTILWVEPCTARQGVSSAGQGLHELLGDALGDVGRGGADKDGVGAAGDEVLAVSA